MNDTWLWAGSYVLALISVVMTITIELQQRQEMRELRSIIDDLHTLMRRDAQTEAEASSDEDRLANAMDEEAG